MKALPWFAVVCALTLLGHYVIYQNNQITRLQQNISITDKAREIEGESVRDLMYANQQLQQENDRKATDAYVTGVGAALQNPDEFEKIWHAGYDRGTEVQMMAQKACPPEPEVDGNFSPVEKSEEHALGF